MSVLERAEMSPRLVILVLAIGTSSCGQLLGECEFPCDHPDFTPQPSVHAGILDPYRVYEYTDQFGDCSGCVRAWNFCYRLGNASRETLFTVERRGPGNAVTRDVIVYPNSDRGNCESYSPDRSDCCIEQVLTEPFTVNYNHHFSLRVYGGISSLLHRHLTEMTNGRIMDRHGQYLSDLIIYKPLFFFRIDTSVSNGRCRATSSTGSTPAPTGTVAEGQEGGEEDSSNTGTVAGVIVAILTIVALLVLAVTVGVVCVRRRHKQRNKFTVNHDRETADGFMNIVYGASNGEQGTVITAEYSLVTAPNKSSTRCEKQTHDNIMNHDYNYPNMTDGMTGSYAVTGAEVSTNKCPSLQYEEESIYEAPASSINGLYAQFEKIRITSIPRTAIKATECLGSGQFGTVNKGVWQSSPDSPRLDVAIKTLNSSANEADRVRFLQEGAIMGQFRHPNVVKLHGIVRDEQTVLLVIELLAKTDLREHLLLLRPQDGGEGDSSLPHTLLSYCRQVAAGIDYLSRRGFIHRDIAARNILLSQDYEMCKIADFGMSRGLADETYYISSGGKIPVKWTAPEALHYKKYSTASDVWSFGCLMYEIWSLGHKPFEDCTNPEVIKMVDAGFRLAPPPGCPRALYQLMINCWDPVTSQRPLVEMLTQSLGRSDPVLLKWDVSDKPAAAPLALKLGAPLNSTTLLYPDLQRAYLPAEVTNIDYEEPT